MMVRVLKHNHDLTIHVVKDIIAGNNPFDIKPEKGQNKNVLLYGRNGTPIKAKTKNLYCFISSLKEMREMLFGVRPESSHLLLRYSKV